MTGTHQGYKFLSRSARTNLPWHRPVEGEIKTVTIKRDVNHWYVCFSVERDSVALPESSEDIGMDVGLDSFVALSNGMEIDNPRHLKRGLRSEEHTSELQSQSNLVCRLLLEKKKTQFSSEIQYKSK